MNRRSQQLVIFSVLLVLALCVSGVAEGAAFCFDNSPSVPAGDAPYSVIVAHMDNDGILDLAVANHLGSDVSILYGQGAGLFGPANNILVGTGPTSVHASDLDGDGDNDLCTASRNGTTITVLMNTGAGFARTDYTVGDNPFCVTAADFDSDGDLDLAYVLLYVGTVGTLENDGTGNFTPGPSSTAGGGPHWVSAADFDGDGDLDLAVANHLSNNLSLLFNDGTGSFSGPTDYAAGAMPMSVCASDLNGDLHPDVIVSNNDSHNITVLMNQGTGTLTTGTSYAVGDHPWFSLAADVDDDGDNDVIVANTGSQSVTILENTGAGSLLATSSAPAGNVPSSLAHADVDRDGDVDLVAANIEGDCVTILYNSRISQETFCDGFETMPPGTLPSCTWIPTGNIAGIVIDNTVASTGMNSLKLYGQLGGCMSAEPSRAFVRFPISISLSVRNGLEQLSGCHQFRAGLGVNSVPVPGAGPGTSPFDFLPDGNLEVAFAGPRPSFSGFTLGEWHNIQCYLWLPGDGQLHLRIWGNGRYLGEYTTAEEGWMSAGGYINLSCGEGTAWFDDVCVMEMPACVPELPLCGFDQNDANCDGVVDVLDVVLTVSVAFRGQQPNTSCCSLQR